MARLIIECLNLEGVQATEIDPAAALFENGGWGLDSIDVLEVVVAIAEEYQVHISAEDEASRQIFASLESLTDHVTRESQARSIAL